MAFWNEIRAGKQFLRSKTTTRALSSVTVPLRGKALLTDRYLNKGTAFTKAERDTFELHGLLPQSIQTLQQQQERAYEQYCDSANDLAKNVFMSSLLQQNVVLFHALFATHMKEMLPVVYTPTEGRAIENYSHLFRRPDGCFLSIDEDADVESMAKKLRQAAADSDVQYIVVTDGEQILGLGDEGVGGIMICVAKQVLVSACGGIDPIKTLPVVLDVGTDNPRLRSSQMYLGSKHRRTRGEAYDEFVANFVKAATQAFPDVYIHFEDFGVSTASRILDRYHRQHPCFNDDIQGTGCVAVAAILAGLQVGGIEPSEARFLMYGAGSAGCGIALQVARYLACENSENLSAASRSIVCFDRQGLITDALGEDISDKQAVFAEAEDDWRGIDTKDLRSVIDRFEPHVLVGTSTHTDAFYEDAVKAMASHVDRPVILPLSNPTQLAEAQPKDLISWTDGRALVATGSPFDAVEYKGAHYEIGLCNNILCFPGIGLGTILCKAPRVSDEMLVAAVKATVAHSPMLKKTRAALVAGLEDARAVSAAIATAVITAAQRQDLCMEEGVPSDAVSLKRWVDEKMWSAEYPAYQPSANCGAPPR